MKTEKQIKQKVLKHAAHLRSASDYRDADSCIQHESWIAALNWVLDLKTPSVKFGCPKCGNTILRMEPALGYFEYYLDTETGETVVPENNFNAQNCAPENRWYECSLCFWRADEEWKEWYAREAPKEERETEEEFPNLHRVFSEENSPRQD